MQKERLKLNSNFKGERRADRLQWSLLVLAMGIGSVSFMLSYANASRRPQTEALVP